MDVDSLDFQGIAYIQKDGKIATIGINFFNKQMDQLLILDIKMRELSDGTWQITEIINLKDFFANMGKAQRAYYISPPIDIKPLQVQEQEYKDEICKIKYPQIEIANHQEVQEKINLAIKEEVDKKIEHGKEIGQIKKFGTVPYSLNMQYKIQLNDGKLFSLTFDDYSFTGGAHGQIARMGMVFDATTGKKIQWDDFYMPIDISRRVKINQIVLQQAKERNILIFKPFKGVSDHPTFYVNESRNPVIIFQPYEIASFASGILEFELGKENLI